MALSLHQLPKTHKKKAKRVGRGGKRGTYSGRGIKGQRARSGGKKGLKYKGFRQQLLGVPKKRGFKSPHPKAQGVNLSELARRFQEGETVSPATLKEKGLISSLKRPVKILGRGKLTKKLEFKNVLFSQRARQQVESLNK